MKFEIGLLLTGNNDLKKNTIVEKQVVEADNWQDLFKLLGLSIPDSSLIKTIGVSIKVTD